MRECITRALARNSAHHRTQQGRQHDDSERQRATQRMWLDVGGVPRNLPRAAYGQQAVRRRAGGVLDWIPSVWSGGLGGQPESMVTWLG